jgi:CRP-like cAMP-binding protein
MRVDLRHPEPSLIVAFGFALASERARVACSETEPSSAQFTRGGTPVRDPMNVRATESKSGPEGHPPAEDETSSFSDPGREASEPVREASNPEIEVVSPAQQQAAAALREHVFVGGLERRLVERLASIARTALYEHGALLAKKGELATALYLLTAGSVELVEPGPRGGTITLQRLAAGDVLGVDWVSPEGRWTLDARAVGSVAAVVIDAAELDRQVDADRDLGRALVSCALRHARLRGLAPQPTPRPSRGS